MDDIRDARPGIRDPYVDPANARVDPITGRLIDPMVERRPDLVDPAPQRSFGGYIAAAAIALVVIVGGIALFSGGREPAPPDQATAPGTETPMQRTPAPGTPGATNPGPTSPGGTTPGSPATPGTPSR